MNKKVYFFAFLALLLLNVSVQAQTTASKEKTTHFNQCVRLEHGLMLNCVFSEIQELTKDAHALKKPNPSNDKPKWRAPEEYKNLTNKIPDTSENIQSGEKIYHFYCSGCHGVDAQGSLKDPIYNANIPDLTNPKLLGKTDGALFWKITEGNWPMPAFWEGDTLSEEDIWKLVHYLRTLQSAKNERAHE